MKPLALVSEVQKMVTIKEKLNLFSEWLYQDVIEKNEKELKQIEEENRTYIESYKRELEKRVTSIHRNMENKISQKKNEMISKANLEVKQNILIKKQECFDCLIDEQIKKAKEFTKTKAYEAFFIKTLETVLDKLKNAKSIAISLTKQDRQRFQVLIEELAKKKGLLPANITYQDAPEEIIGGMMVSDEGAAICYNASIMALIEDKKEFIMKKLDEELKKAGDGIDA
ncbi:MAG TPA: V-type ATP synthase subunit E [Defluviitaleaceae bacterium]|nr:V-type ATP synthase subunit E [Defluviitaleaceae bacterium]HPT75704.1 V-type ATP synthase subunit E [Defluviitaleaceae bacterium]